MTMKDINITNYQKIRNSLPFIILGLSVTSEIYGVRFYLWRTGNNQITLELTNKKGKVIDSIILDFNVNVSNVTEMSSNGWVEHVRSLVAKEARKKIK